MEPDTTPTDFADLRRQAEAKAGEFAQLQDDLGMFLRWRTLTDAREVGDPERIDGIRLAFAQARPLIGMHLQRIEHDHRVVRPGERLVEA